MYLQHHFSPNTFYSINSHKYFVLQILGRGSQAIALKVQKTDDQIITLRVYEFAQATPEYLITLNHPFIQQCYLTFAAEINVTNWQCIEEPMKIVVSELEYVEFELAKRYTQLDEPQIEKVIVQICCAVQFLHIHKIVHRDIKLSNIYLDSNLNVKLADFGLSRILVDKPMSACGTPGYMAPEVLHMQNAAFGDKQVSEYGYLVDEWSLGVLTYLLCTKSMPYSINAYQQLSIMGCCIDFSKICNRKLRALCEFFLVADIKRRKSVKDACRLLLWDDVVKLGRQDDFYSSS